ncbi:reverse transcriptase domain-containing protein [Tanacetum coccineum]
MTNLTDMLTKFVNSNTASTSSSGTLPSNTITNLKDDLKGITTRSGVAYQGPTIPTTPSSLPKVVERETEPVVAPVSSPKLNPKPSIPYPSRLNDQKIREKANNQIEKFYQIFQDLYFDISFADALILMPKFASTLKSLISNKEKLMDECLALADLGASINLMPLSVWKKLSLSELTPTCMTLELADRSISHPIGIAEDVYVKVGKFQFLTDFVVLDFDAYPQVPLILGRSFLKNGRALIDVYEGELTLRVGKEAVTFNLDKTSRYSSKYDDNSVNRIDVIDMACEDDFLLEEVNAFLALEDDPTSTEVDHSYYDSEGDILLLEAFLNDDPSLPPPTQGMYLPQIRKELKICETKNDKSSIDEPLEVELKDLPPHIEYAFLEGDDKLPVIIAKDLSVEEKAAFVKVLKSHKRAIAWKLSDIKGINSEFYTHKILIEEDYKPTVTFKFPSTLMIKKRLHSRVLMERSPTIACLSAYAMHRACSLMLCDLDIEPLSFVFLLCILLGLRSLILFLIVLSSLQSLAFLETMNTTILILGHLLEELCKSEFAELGQTDDVHPELLRNPAESAVASLNVLRLQKILTVSMGSEITHFRICGNHEFVVEMNGTSVIINVAVRKVSPYSCTLLYKKIDKSVFFEMMHSVLDHYCCPQHDRTTFCLGGYGFGQELSKSDTFVIEERGLKRHFHQDISCRCGSEQRTCVMTLFCILVNLSFINEFRLLSQSALCLSFTLSVIDSLLCSVLASIDFLTYSHELDQLSHGILV